MPDILPNQASAGTAVTEGQVAGQPTTQAPDPAGNQQIQQQQSQPFLKIKHLDKEYELAQDDAVRYAQKGFDYDRIREKYDNSKPVLDFVGEIAKENGMDLNTWLNQVRLSREQARVQQLAQQQGIPEDVAKEIIENRNFRNEYQQKEQQQAAKDKETAEMKEFLELYPDVVPEKIPVEVWQERAKGRTLSEAYSRHENTNLKTKIASLEQLVQTQQANQQNAQNSTGPVTGQGNAPAEFYTKEQVANMSQSEVKANLAKIEASMSKW